MCSIETCTRPAKIRGMCSSHYKMWWAKNRLTDAVQPHGQVTRFIEYSVQYSGEECLIWPFCTRLGYGRALYAGKLIDAHRLVWQLFNHAEIPQGQVVRHLCGNGQGGCVNPHHLATGTPMQNCQDKVVHGTDYPNREWGQNRLTPDEVREIRCKSSEGVINAELAAEYSKSVRTIQDAVNRHTWKNVE